MYDELARWAAQAESWRAFIEFELPEDRMAAYTFLPRIDDFYTALVGELFRAIQQPDDPTDWPAVGNALGLFAAPGTGARLGAGIDRGEAALYSSAAFYLGGYPASARLVLRLAHTRPNWDGFKFLVDFLKRPGIPTSDTLDRLLAALRADEMGQVAAELQRAGVDLEAALEVGPTEYIESALRADLLERFARSNLRAVLPERPAEFWNDYVGSCLDRPSPIWEYFPSQIQAIRAGLLTEQKTFSLQMPTSAGKTALCEVLAYDQLRQQPDTRVLLLVPFRALAAELRSGPIARLKELGFDARSVYGGSVPTSDERAALDEAQFLVATPEKLSALLATNEGFLSTVSVVICDEGHLLDEGTRGVAYELLLTRLRLQAPDGLRFVFLSAIVPNIGEINSWLGGDAESVVEADYRPVALDFATRRARGSGATAKLDLDVNAHQDEPDRYRLYGVLEQRDFRYRNPATGRMKTWKFDSFKTRAVAIARKALPAGTVAVFAPNKRGREGVIALANELLNQQAAEIPLPNPIEHTREGAVEGAREYVTKEYGAAWTLTKVLTAGAALHHGDLPQELREVLERLVRNNGLRLVFCTSTLAEGVNLPLRTLVLYSAKRVDGDGGRKALPRRTLKNLVGRVGRAGSETRGMVICANEGDWPILKPVATEAALEPVRGGLARLVEALVRFLAQHQLVLSNELLEAQPAVFGLLDAMDSLLVDLMAEELDAETLREAALRVAADTFLSTQAAADSPSMQLLAELLGLRSEAVSATFAAGRGELVRSLGISTRTLGATEAWFASEPQRWQDVDSPLDSEWIEHLVRFAWQQLDFAQEVKDLNESYRKDLQPLTEEDLVAVVRLRVAGAQYRVIAAAIGWGIDLTLGTFARLVEYRFQSVVDRATTIATALADEHGVELSAVAQLWNEHLRHGQPTDVGVRLAQSGVRHRSAIVFLAERGLTMPIIGGAAALRDAAGALAVGVFAELVERVGSLAAENTLRDLGVDPGLVQP